MPPQPASREGIPPRTPVPCRLLSSRFQSRSSPTPSLRVLRPPPLLWAPLTCGSARGRWAPAGPGSEPGSGRAGALLACGRAPCPRGPGRVARRGCPCTGSPGGPWAPPGGASGLQTASRGAGEAGVKQTQASAGQTRAPVPGAVSCVSPTPSPRPVTLLPTARARGGRGRRNRAALAEGGFASRCRKLTEARQLHRALPASDLRKVPRK